MSDQLGMLGVMIVERLVELGAEIMVRDDGDVAVAFAQPGFGRRSREPDPWLSGFTDGAMRELWNIMKLVPGAEAAVREHVRAYPRERCGRMLVA